MPPSAARHTFAHPAKVILACLICLLASSSMASAGLLPERVETAAKERVAAGFYPTLVFAVVEGEKSEIVAFGELSATAKPDRDTVYEIGSITKTFTATLLADAVVSGRVTLEEPVARLLPNFSVPEQNGKQITLADLATQRSGLPRLPTNQSPADPANPYADYSAVQLSAFLANYNLPRDPGASYEYSNLGFGLLGYALARSVDTTYSALLEEKILNPLGMSMSGTALTEAMRAHLAPGHNETGKPAKNWDFDALAGAGAIRSTAADMLKYLKANMGAVQTPLTVAMKLAQKPRVELDQQNRIGLAWMSGAPEHGDIISHGGQTGGYAGFIGFRADGSRGVVILTNASVGVEELGFAVLSDGAPLTRVGKTATLPPGELDRYEGSYKLADNFVLKVFRDGDQLYAQATNQGAFPIFPSGPNEFFAKVSGISISFTRGADGAITGLILHQNGDHAARKLSAAETPREPKAVQLDAGLLASYPGRYQLAPGAVIEVTLKDGQLKAQLTGQEAASIYASAKDKFFYKIVDAQLDFERDANGKVIAVVLHQNGRDLRAPRIAP